MVGVGGERGRSSKHQSRSVDSHLTRSKQSLPPPLCMVGSYRGDSGFLLGQVALLCLLQQICTSSLGQDDGISKALFLQTQLHGRAQFSKQESPAQESLRVCRQSIPSVSACPQTSALCPHLLYPASLSLSHPKLPRFIPSQQNAGGCPGMPRSSGKFLRTEPKTGEGLMAASQVCHVFAQQQEGHSSLSRKTEG